MGEKVDMHVGPLTRASTIVAAVLIVMTFPTWAAADGPQRHAVVIGINDYADKAIPDLKYAEADARAVHGTLIDPAVGRFPKENVRLILGPQASNDNIKAALYALRRVGKDDLVVIYFSGHGAKEGEQAFWVTQAAQRRALPVTSLRNKEIRELLAKIPSQRMVIFLDCCYAASTVKKSLDDPAQLFGDFAGKGRATIAGAAESQEALEYEDKKSGVFTHFLVSGLRGKADRNEDGAVTFEELWTYLGENVRRASVKQGGLHEPKIITEEGITPQFLLTFNPAAQPANDERLKALRELFHERRITAAQYDEGHLALTSPAIDSVARAKREVFADLVAGKIRSKYLETLLEAAVKKARETVAGRPVQPGEKPAVAVVPFKVYGDLRVKDAGEILAERLLPMFGGRYTLIDQMQLRRFVDQDDLTLTGLAEIARTRSTKSLPKAVRLRAVRYLVAGSISANPDGSVSVTARLSDWQTGRIASDRVAQIAGDNWTDLLRRLPLLAARLTGSLGEIGPGPEVVLPPLPSGVDELTARVLQLEAIEAELKQAERTLTDKHPRIAFLQSNLKKLAKALAVDVKRKLAELQAADAKLADTYKAAHPRRAALLQQIAEFRKAQSGVLFRACPPKELTLNLGGGVTLWCVLIPAGKFMMGSPAGEKDRYGDEGPRRHVTISKPFYMGVYEVTQEQYEQVTNSNPAWSKGAKRPVDVVSWDDAVAFCRKVSQRTGGTVRLPTEAEWEYACRAGTKGPFHSGNTISSATANYDATYVYGTTTRGTFRRRTLDVGSFAANAFGLHDMHGNVWEWCFDWYGSYPSEPTTDYAGPSTGKERVLRGGSWRDVPRKCRSAYRWKQGPAKAPPAVGFRVVVDLSIPEAKK